MVDLPANILKVPKNPDGALTSRGDSLFRALTQVSGKDRFQDFSQMFSSPILPFVDTSDRTRAAKMFCSKFYPYFSLEIFLVTFVVDQVAWRNLYWRIIFSRWR